MNSTWETALVPRKNTFKFYVQQITHCAIHISKGLLHGQNLKHYKTFCAVPFRSTKQPGKKELQAT